MLKALRVLIGLFVAVSMAPATSMAQSAPPAPSNAAAPGTQPHHASKCKQKPNGCKKHKKQGQPQAPQGQQAPAPKPSARPYI